MQQELMELYKEHNVNPFGSCLPLLIQAPVFIALNAVLRYHIHADRRPGFLGITNIFVTAEQDRHGPRVHADRRSTSARCSARRCCSRSSPIASRSTCWRRCRSCSCRSSCASRPGVMIYWITSNFWTIGQQGMIKRTMGHRFPQPPSARAASTGKGGDKGGGGVRARAAASRPADGGKRRRARHAAGARQRPPLVAAAGPALRPAPGRAQAVTEPAVRVEATGETVGEARWAALHELERRYPGARPRPGRVRRRSPRASAGCSASATSRRG